MQDIRQETLNECTRAEQSASVVLWEIDLTEVGAPLRAMSYTAFRAAGPICPFVPSLLITTWLFCSNVPDACDRLSAMLPGVPT